MENILSNTTMYSFPVNRNRKIHEDPNLKKYFSPSYKLEYTRKKYFHLLVHHGQYIITVEYPRDTDIYYRMVIVNDCEPNSKGEFVRKILVHKISSNEDGSVQLLYGSTNQVFMKFINIQHLIQYFGTGSLVSYSE